MKKFLLFAAIFIAFSPSAAFPMTTEWMTVSEFDIFGKELRRSGEKPVKIKCKIGDEFGNVLVKITTASNKKNERWQMGLYRASRKLFAGNKVSIDYVVNPKSGAITSCWIE